MFKSLIAAFAAACALTCLALTIGAILLGGSLSVLPIPVLMVVTLLAFGGWLTGIVSRFPLLVLGALGVGGFLGTDVVVAHHLAAYAAIAVLALAAFLIALPREHLRKILRALTFGLVGIGAATALSGCALTSMTPADTVNTINALASAGCKGTLVNSAGVQSAAGASPGGGHIDFTFTGSCDPSTVKPAPASSTNSTPLAPASSGVAGNTAATATPATATPAAATPAG